MKKNLAEMTWPIAGYTEKIDFSLKYMFNRYPHLTFTVKQMHDHVVRGYSWMKDNTEHQNAVLDRVIRLGLKKWIQCGLIKKVSSKVSVEPQWMSARGAGDSNYANCTSVDAVAVSKEAQEAVAGRPVNGRTLWKLNNP